MTSSGGSVGDPDSDVVRRADDLLRQYGAPGIAHPGGTLYAHLHRVAHTLHTWDACHDLVVAGLMHATYGTDGFPTALTTLDGRYRIAAAIGVKAEAILYDYASCDRANFYPQLVHPRRIRFRDRFTGKTRPLNLEAIRDFVELTFANELDVLANSRDIAARHGPSLLDTLTAWTDLASPPARAALEVAQRSIAARPQ